ncbi:MAG: DUF3873 domain-containing protein [Prevotella sp.]|nr:DUF3873 domain-containing protein [Prevotella sp.]
MSTQMNINGLSTCRAAGMEQYESFQLRLGRRTRNLIQYDYRHTDGELFSCVKPTLAACRAERDRWIARHTGNKK